MEAPSDASKTSKSAKQTLHFRRAMDARQWRAVFAIVAGPMCWWAADSSNNHNTLHEQAKNKRHNNKW